MQRPRIIIKRSGLFACAGLVEDNQCAAKGVKAFRYAIEVECERLDERSFVVDNNDLHTVMQTWNDGGQWSASCEQFAGGAVREIYNLCSHAKKITVEIIPTDFASVRVVWSDECESLPDFEPQIVKPSRRRGRSSSSKTTVLEYAKG